MDNKKYKVGMYGGKFMPFHKGHLHCVEVASKLCDKLYVILFHGSDQEIEILKTRKEEWLTVKSREEHMKKACEKFDNVEVATIDVTKCKKDDGTEDWDKETSLVLDVCGHLDAVFGSEVEYTDYYKRAYPDAVYEIIDIDRKAFPISGTKIRNMKDEAERKKWIV